MSGLNGVMDTALTGLNAYRASLDTVSENISNQTTPGYARRRAVLSSQLDGVSVDSIQRVVSQFANSRLQRATSGNNAAQVTSQYLSAISSDLPLGGGLSQAMNSLFSDLKAVATSPADIPTRQTAINDVAQLASHFNQTATSLSQKKLSIAQTLGSDVSQANQVLSQLAQINQTLQKSPGQNVNSLLDQQQAAVQTLSGLLGVHVLRNPDHTLRISVAGTVLLDRAGARTINETTSASGVTSLSVGSNAQPLRPGAQDGRIGAELAGGQRIAAIGQQLNRMATLTAALVNQQQAYGRDLYGNQGGPLFSVPTPTVTAGAGNAGSATLTAQLTDATQLPADGGPFRLVYSGGTWQATDTASGKTTALGGGTTLSFDGLQVTVSGTPTSGDTFTLDPAPSAAALIAPATSDPKAIAAAVPYAATAGTVGASGSVTDTNAGSVQAGGGSVVSTPASGALTVPAGDYGQTLQVVFTGTTTYQVQTGGGTVIGSGSYAASSGGNVAIAYPGAASGHYWQIPFSGTPAPGDTFTLRPPGASSGGNANTMSQLNTADVVQGGSLSDAWAGVTADIGAQAKSASTRAQDAQATLKSAQDQYQQISGVSQDNQATQMMRYSQAYQAVSRVIATTNQLFKGLIAATG